MLSPWFTLSRDMRKGRAALSHIPGGVGGLVPHPTKNHNKLSGIGVCSFFDFCAGAGDDADDADADDGLGLETFLVARFTGAGVGVSGTSTTSAESATTES